MNTEAQVIENYIRLAIEEDLGDGDHTSLACIPEDAVGKAVLNVKEEGIIAGVEIAQKVFSLIDPSLSFKRKIKDGEKVKVGDVVFELSGSSRSMLQGERLCLNIMQRMSGIATQVNKIATELIPYGVQLLDTRKTTPNFRVFEKMAVKIGGATNHRFGLYDMIMIKDNHVDFAGGVVQAIDAVQDYIRKNEKDLKIEIEVRDFGELNSVLKRGGVHRIMLDNFSIENIEKAVKIIGRRYEIEASGGISLDDIFSYAKTGVNYISMGMLTHHVNSLDLSLKAV